MSDVVCTERWARSTDTSAFGSRKRTHVPTRRVKSDASAVKIRKTYRDLSQMYHPDKFDKKVISEQQAKEKFQEIARAYEVRLTPVSTHDEWLVFESTRHIHLRRAIPPEDDLMMDADA